MTEFDNLPQHLIYYIWNFLPYKDAFRCSVSSKAFHSCWLSYPKLELDFFHFAKYEDPVNKFFSFIDKTINLRSLHPNNSLQKFKLRHLHQSTETPFIYQTLFDKLVKYATENTSKEIDFEIVSYGFINVRQEPLDHLLSSNFLTVLNLEGLRFSNANPIIQCPKLKALQIWACQGLRNIIVSSSCVEKVNIHECRELEVFQVPKARNLCHFGFGPTCLHPCDFDLPSCESINSMSLSFLKISKSNMKEPVTDTLSLKLCHLPMNFRIQNNKLKELKIDDIYNLDNLSSLYTPNLERLCFRFDKGFLPSQSRGITMDITTCVALKVLELEEVAITDEWVKRVISNLGCLDELIISRCTSLRKLEFKNDKLEILSLEGCSDLKEANIDAPNLVKFNYEGSMEVHPLVISATKCSVKIKLLRPYIDPALRSNAISQFLSCFYHIKDITFTSPRVEDLISLLEHMSEHNPFPLRDLKYMKVETLGQKPNSEDVMKIIEGLLWLAPKPLELTVSVGNKIHIGTLKFEYGKKVKRTKVDDRFGIGVSTRCWRNFELKVDIQGFNESETRGLYKFFSPYLH